MVLIDFWAYSCINCQRAIPHVVDWYDRYRDDAFVVIGVHTPEYTFERVPGNVADGAATLHITYPVALDNDYATWNSYQNLYWPAEYLIDASGIVRHTKLGEGDYDVTEKLIRRLLTDADPGVRYPPTLAADRFALRGRWTLDDQGATADSNDAAIRLDCTAKDVYAVVGGTGTITVTRGGRTTTTAIGGPPTLHQIVNDATAGRDELDMQVSPGVQVFPFTFG